MHTMCVCIYIYMYPNKALGQSINITAALQCVFCGRLRTKISGEWKPCWRKPCFGWRC